MVSLGLYTALVMLLIGITDAGRLVRGERQRGTKGTKSKMTKDSLPRIFHGDDTTLDEFPFMVSLQDPDSRDHWCGGALISTNVVLTAAHCVVYEDDSVVYPSEVVAVLGAWNLTSDNETGVVFEVARVKVHEGYDSWTLVNDIAVLILKDGVDPEIAINLPDDNSLSQQGTSITVIGWGGTEDLYLAEVLQKHEYVVSDQAACNKTWSTVGYPIYEGMLCTGDAPLDGHSWQGDSGGPLFHKKQNGEFELVALVSWGNDQPDNSTQDVNTDVWFYKEWIMKNSDPENTVARFELVGGDQSHGVVVYEDFYRSGTICADKLGYNEVRAICQSLNFQDGVQGHISDFQDKNGKIKVDLPNFAVSMIACGANVTNPTSECMFKEYPDEAPCFDGDLLVVKCFDTPWDFKVSSLEFSVKDGTQGSKGKASCGVEAEKYGLPLDVSERVDAVLLNLFNNSGYWDVEVVRGLKFNNKKGAFVTKIKSRWGIHHNCFICYAELKGDSRFSTVMPETSCEGDFEQWINSSRKRLLDIMKAKNGN